MRRLGSLPITVFVVAVSSVLRGGAQEPPKDKAPAAVPTQGAQADAMKLIKEVYGDEYSSAKTAAGRQALAKKLLEKGEETNDDPASKFVLLRLARDVATQACDWRSAFKAVDDMTGSFQIDPIEMKAAVLTKGKSAAIKPDERKSIAEVALELMDVAISADNFPVATQLGELALHEAREVDAKDLILRANSRIANAAEIAKAYDGAKAAEVTLKKTPNDPEANLIVGKYLCLVRNDWGRGLPMLALGRDDSLKALAKQELEGVASSKEQAKLGDGWWDLAEKQDGAAKTQARERARYWYQNALPGLSGLTKDKVEKRIEATASANIGTATERPLSAVASSNLSLVGRWYWEAGGKPVYFSADGLFRAADDPPGAPPGRWRCVDMKTRKFQVAWGERSGNSITVSTDGNALYVEDMFSDAKWKATRISARPQKQNALQRYAKEIAVDLGKGMKLNLVFIPGGEFREGIDAARQKKYPAAAFYGAVTEVTNQQFARVMGADDTSGSTTARANVSWLEAVEFCNRVSKLDRLPPFYVVDGAINNVSVTGSNGYRLPTSNEWDHAASAGDESNFGPLSSKARMSGFLGHSRAESVPNAFKLRKISSNWEYLATRGAFHGWVDDDPKNPHKASYNNGPEGRAGDISFRVVRDP